MANDSAESIVMTISELIDTTFGDAKVNIVHHKFLQSILFLLARQLRVLERRVVVKLGQIDKDQSTSSISVTELKLLAMGTKKDTKTKPSKQAPIDSTQKSMKQGAVSDVSSKKSKSPPSKTSDKKSSGRKSGAKASSSEETLSDKASSAQQSEATGPSAKKHDKKTNLQEHQELLDAVELIRERELRVVHQRADSREEHDKTPTPIRSLESVEAKFEKLLVVERVPVEEAKARAAQEKTGGRVADPKTQLSIVTKEQFDDLVAKVQKLLQRFEPVGSAGFPENARLMLELRRGASLTDAMAALQLSARLEAVEKIVKNMLSLISGLAMETGIDLNTIVSTNDDSTDDVEVLFGAGKDKKMLKKDKSLGKQLKGAKSEASSAAAGSEAGQPPQTTSGPGDDSEPKRDRVTFQELDDALKDVTEQIMKQVQNVVSRNSTNADTAVKLATRLETTIKSSMNFGTKMEELETLVANFADQINILDTSLTSQMTNYQDELMQMQHDLECGLENMAEMMANTGSDAVAVAELNAHFTNLQYEIDNTVVKQKDLKGSQRELSTELETLRLQIELLRETKSDREEVVDALRDKAGIGDLNGLTTCEQFNAVRGDFENRIAMAYDKFNNQETIWQKALDDIQRDLNEKADAAHMEDLRTEINRHFKTLNAKQKLIADIVGEPSAAALAKRLNRDAACLSCSTPAHMNIVKPTRVQKLPEFKPALNREASTAKGDGDRGVCFPGYPITHPQDPRSPVCNRWCGGSHTLLNSPRSRVPPSMIITPVKRGDVTMDSGTDGKMYAVDKPGMPCSQCKISKPVSPEPEPILNPYHMCLNFDLTAAEDASDVTPPLIALETE